jgi:hypothetical protein
VSYNRLKVEDRETLVRDVFSGAILNTDLAAVHAYKAKKNDINKMRQLETKVVNMENDIRDIKTLLQQLVEGKNNP